MTEPNAGHTPHDSTEESRSQESTDQDSRSPVSRIRNADEQLQHAADALDEDEWSKASIQAIRSDLVRILSALEDEDDGEQEIVTDGGRDSPKGDIRITLGRDDVRHLMDNGTTVLQKEVGPLTVNIRTHQRLEAVVMLAGRNVDPEPEVLED